MKIQQLIKSENILLNSRAATKEDMIEDMIALLSENGYLSDTEQFKKDIWERENEIPTEIGFGVAIPHAKSSAVKETAIVLSRTWKGIESNGERTHLLFMIAAKENETEEHLTVLSALSTFLMDESFRAKLILAKDADEIVALFEAQNLKEEEESSDQQNIYQGKKLVGITGCMTGIAHTYMAAEGLEDAAKALGMAYKIQKNGANGIENRLTAADIQEADAIVVAADTKVDLSVFEGKNVVKVPVKDGIHKPKALIEQALQQKGSFITESQSSLDRSKEKTRMAQPGFYNHIMTGVSYMIPFVVAGGIFIAISFMFGIHAANPEDPSYNVFAAFLDQMGGGAAFGLMVPVLSGYIAYSIADKQGIAPGMIGGMMAVIGGSGFLGGLISGFIAGYAVLYIQKWLKKLPKAIQGINAVLLNPLFSTFIVGLIMYFAVNSPMLWLNETLQAWLSSLSGINAGLLGAILAGMMASDMGGPINKTASAFGLAMFASGIYEPSAALMVGGMVPPLGIALATTLFKNRFNKEEQEAGKAAYILGASFITEAAIPFAAADPLRIIPANIIGSAIGGAICMALGISLRAPHGGIFVIPLAASRPLMYIFSILIGSIITALIIGYLKKPIDDSAAAKQSRSLTV